MPGLKTHIANRIDTILIFAVLLGCLGLQQITYKLREEWPGLPPAPKVAEASIYGFGDIEFAYRNIGLMLQNAGDTGGRVTHISTYDFQTIRDWLWLSYELDPRADYVPSLAAFYFGATKKPDEIGYLVDYLAKVGEDKGPERWRWLAHAVYLARFIMKDQPKALELAERLAALDDPDLPIWTKQMPAYVMSHTGQKKAARDLLLTIAATQKGLDPAEINQTCYFINEHLREANDDLEHNEVYKILCSAVHNQQINNK